MSGHNLKVQPSHLSCCWPAEKSDRKKKTVSRLLNSSKTKKHTSNIREVNKVSLCDSRLTL